MSRIAFDYLRSELKKVIWAMSPLWKDEKKRWGWNTEFANDFTSTLSDCCHLPASVVTSENVLKEFEKDKYETNTSRPVVWMDVEGLSKSNEADIMLDDEIREFFDTLGLKLTVYKKAPFIMKKKEKKDE